MTNLPHELFEEQIIERLPLSACVALAATCTSLSKECALRVRIDKFLQEAKAEFEAAREREAKLWFPHEGAGEMEDDEDQSDWSENEF
jgi:hypothetical protein